MDRPKGRRGVSSPVVLVQMALSRSGGRPDRRESQVEEEGAREEFREIAVSAGATPVASIIGRRKSPDPKTFVGPGKIEQIREAVKNHGAELVLFAHALSPAQERNLERALGCRVLDRIGLILDIFATRASTFEGKLQVELAQLRHLSTRLVRGWTHLERQKGGIGLRGPGETQLETDRRLIGIRIKQINRRLETVRRRRRISAKLRDKREVPVVSIVGYTNAGKSTLFNRLTGADVLAEDRLFATLDPTLRRLSQSAEPGMVIADTVGFIHDLPHALIAAFRATLEETQRASLLLHVIDASSPGKFHRISEVNHVLAEIGVASGDDAVQQIQVFNKVDFLVGESSVPRVERDSDGAVRSVWVSAKTGAGLDLLYDCIEECLGRQRLLYRVTFPASEGRLRAQLYAEGRVQAESYDAKGGVALEVRISNHALQRLTAELKSASVFVVELSDSSEEIGRGASVEGEPTDQAEAGDDASSSVLWQRRRLPAIA